MVWFFFARLYQISLENWGRCFYANNFQSLLPQTTNIRWKLFIESIETREIRWRFFNFSSKRQTPGIVLEMSRVGRFFLVLYAVVVVRFSEENFSNRFRNTLTLVFINFFATDRSVRSQKIIMSEETLLTAAVFFFCKPVLKVEGLKLNFVWPNAILIAKHAFCRIICCFCVEKWNFFETYVLFRRSAAQN